MTGSLLQLHGTLQPVALPFDEVASSRLAEVRRFAAGASAAAVARRLAKAVSAVTSDSITIAFGGHWNAGKSTLINTLLGRTLLPVSERTETGASCYIRAGRADQACSLRAGEWQPIECTTAAIANEISITGANAEPRPEIAAVAAIQLTLEDAPIPPNVSWIDTPGLNDSPLMQERLRSVVHRADFLLWIINPDQPLSEVEQTFLADYAQRRGAAAMAFIINVRTRRDVQREWAEYLAEAWASHLAKIEDFGKAIGCIGAAEPHVLAITGRDLSSDRREAELRAFLNGTDGILGRRVLAGRLHRLTSAIERLAKVVERGNAIRRKRIQREQATAALRESKLKAFRIAATALLRDTLHGLRETARIAGTSIVLRAHSSTAQTEADLGASLSREVHRLMAVRWMEVVPALRAAASKAEVPFPSDDAFVASANQLATPHIIVRPPAVTPTGGAANLLWGCAIPFVAILLLVALFARDSLPSLFWAILICAAVAAIVSHSAGVQRVRDLPQRVDQAIMTATANHEQAIPSAVEPLVISSRNGRWT